MRKPVLLKRGIAATIEEWLLSAEYILSGGNHDVILCERGIRTFETCDPQHPGHLRDPGGEEAQRTCPSSSTRATARAAATRSCPWRAPRWPRAPTGCIIEVHPDPDKALSDGAQTLYPEQFERLMGELRIIAPVLGRSLPVSRPAPARLR